MAGIIIQPNTITVAYEEMDGSPTQSLPTELQARDATRTLMCNWADRLTLAKELRGYTNRSGANDVVYHAKHAFPWDPVLLCSSVSISPYQGTLLGGMATQAGYTKALLQCHYTFPKKDENDPAQVLVTESLEPSLMMLTRPQRGLYWSSTEAIDEYKVTEFEQPSLPVKMLVWTFTAHKLLAIPAAVGTLINKVNSSAVRSVTFGLNFPAKTLLYGPPQLSADYLDDGTRAYKLTYRFEYNPDGWNKFPKPYKFGGGMAYMYDKNHVIWEPFEAADFLPVLMRTFG